MLTDLSNYFYFESAFVEYPKLNETNKNDFVIKINLIGNRVILLKVLEFCMYNLLKSF
jgi:hypothetical protein